MIRDILTILFLFSFSPSFGQKSDCNKNCFSKPISKSCKIIFNKYNSAFKLYGNPSILINGKAHKIKGYDLNNYTGRSVRVSPDKKYLVMDYIIKGYVLNKDDSTLYENYNCIIVDIRKFKIIQEIQSDCDGKWNRHNQWVSNKVIIFEKNILYYK